MADIYDFKTGEKIFPETNNTTAKERIARGLKQLRSMYLETTQIESSKLFNPVDSERHHARLETELADILETDLQ